ncbi:MAG: phytanoyl-CoA dioxygenase family protein [Planctomycetota bacterium]
MSGADYHPDVAALQAYREQGFFVTPVIFPVEQMAALRSACDTVWAEQRAAAATWDDPVERALVQTRPFICDLHQRHPAFLAFLRCPRFLAIARAMLGPDADVCYNQTVIKPPSQEPNDFAWHQDTYYASLGPDSWNMAVMADDSRTFQSWLAISDTDLSNGTLQVLPGSHRRGFPPYEQVRPDHGERRALVDVGAAQAVELQAGQMLVFSGMLLHASGSNRSGATRYVYQFCTAQPGARPLGHSLPIMRGGQATR